MVELTLTCSECRGAIKPDARFVCGACEDEAYSDGQDAAASEKGPEPDSTETVVRDWLDRRKMNPCAPTREQVEFVELLIDDLGAR